MAERRPRDGRKKMEKLKMKCYISYKFNIFIYKIKPGKQKQQEYSRLSQIMTHIKKV